MNVESWDQLQLTQAKDRELDEGATALGYLVIRVGCDMVDKRTGELTETCKIALRDAVENGRLGECRRIGSVYG
jgi:very-short-patch-repair endonuclease